MTRVILAALILIGPASANLSARDSIARDEIAFMKALEKFDAAKTPDDYRESASVLESLLATGYRSGAVYYNLGNAYYRAGDFGRAILNYRKAKPYRPRDPYLTANLEQALAAATGRSPELPRSWWTHVLFWTSWLSYPSKIHLMFACAAIAAVGTALASILNRPKLYSVSIAILLASLAIGIDAGLSQTDVDYTDQAVITHETVARKGTDNSYEAAFDQPLRDGAEFRVLKSTPDWTFGHFEGIGDGWVRNEFVAR